MPVTKNKCKYCGTILNKPNVRSCDDCSSLRENFVTDEEFKDWIKEMRDRFEKNNRDFRIMRKLGIVGPNSWNGKFYDDEEE